MKDKILQEIKKKREQRIELEKKVDKMMAQREKRRRALKCLVRNI